MTVCEILVRIAARGGDAVQKTQPHFPLKNMHPSKMHQQLSCREQPHTLLACPAGPSAQLSCRHSPTEKPKENTGVHMCFKSHLAALETLMKLPVIVTCCCRAHTARPIIHFLLAKLAGYRHGADSCGFSQVSPYITGHVIAWEKSAVCPEHSDTQILMLMA